MRQQKYTNVILTVNAALLAVLAWTQLVGTPVLARPAEAQVRTQPVEPRFPNAAQQRADITRAVAAVERAVQENTALLQSGDVKVEVTNLSELLIDTR